MTDHMSDVAQRPKDCPQMGVGEQWCVWPKCDCPGGEFATQPPAAPVETPYLGKSFIITSEAAEKIHALPSNLTPSERLRQAVQIARDNPPTKSSAMAMAEAKTAPVLIAAHASEGLPSSDAAGAGAVSRSSAGSEGEPFMMLSCREAKQCLHNIPGCICDGDHTNG